MMASQSVIRCRCGQRVLARDVLQRGYLTSLFGTQYVYVRYRCRHCKKVGEYRVQEKEWDPAVLRQPVRRPTRSELKKFEAMGPVTPDEIVRFRNSVRQLTSLPEQETE
jgi:phage FluMu protein Com